MMVCPARTFHWSSPSRKCLILCRYIISIPFDNFLFVLISLVSVGRPFRTLPSFVSFLFGVQIFLAQVPFHCPVFSFSLTETEVFLFNFLKWHFCFPNLLIKHTEIVSLCVVVSSVPNFWMVQHHFRELLFENLRKKYEKFHLDFHFFISFYISLSPESSWNFLVRATIFPI